MLSVLLLFCSTSVNDATRTEPKNKEHASIQWVTIAEINLAQKALSLQIIIICETYMNIWKQGIRATNLHTCYFVVY